MPPRVYCAGWIALILLSAIGPTTLDEENDGLPGASRSANRKEIEAMIRGVNRDPITPELIDRVDALFRPRWTRPSGINSAKRWLANKDFIATIDEIARETTGKPADTRTLIACSTQIYNTPDRNTHRGHYRTVHERETGPKMTIRGQVVGDEDGKPLAGVIVSDRESLVRTDSKGNYAIKIPRPEVKEDITISFEAPGRALGQTYFEWEDAVPEVEVRDFRLPKAVPFAGRVVDPEGKPIAGVDLEVDVPAEVICRDGSQKAGHNSFVNILEARTDANGLYAFRNIPPDMPDGRIAVRQLKVAHPKYVAKKKIYQQNEELGPGWQITLETGSVVEGTVIDADGKPIHDVSITAHSGPRNHEEPWTSTGKDGKFRFENLAEGSYNIVVRPPQHAMVVVPVDAKQDKPADLKITPEVGVYFEGKVIGTDGKPASNAMVGWIEPIDDRGQVIDPDFYLGIFTRTKEDGTFRVGPVQKGRRYRIGALVDPPRAEAKVEANTDGKPLLMELKPDIR